jgi:DNA-binding transcriptional LysR family regulator
METPGFSELNAVAAVAVRKSFRAAAKDLCMSASALSHAVASLEERLGVRLFNRTTRSVSLTPAGEGFLARIEPAMREIAGAMAAVKEQGETPCGLLRINTSEVAGEQLLASSILEFLRRYPSMQVEVVTEDRFVDIAAEGFDAGVRLTEGVPQDMIAIPVCGPSQRHIVVGSPSYFSGRHPPQSPADLKDHACIRFRLPSGSLYRWEFERHREELRVDVPGSLVLNSARLILRAAIEGAGLAYVNEWNAREALAGKRLVPVLGDWTPPYPGLCLYYPRHRHMTAGMRAFTKLLREATQNQR